MTIWLLRNLSDVLLAGYFILVCVCLIVWAWYLSATGHPHVAGDLIEAGMWAALGGIAYREYRQRRHNAGTN